MQFKWPPPNHRSTPKHTLEAADTPQAAAKGSSTSENLSRAQQLTLRHLCSPAANRIVTLNPNFQEMPSVMTAFKKKCIRRQKRIEVTKDDELRVSSKRASTYRQGSFKDQLPKPGC